MTDSADSESFELPFSKLRVALAALVCFCSAPMAIHLWHLASEPLDHHVFAIRQVLPPVFVYAVSVCTVLALMPFGVYACIKLFDPNPGLVFDREGIIDNGFAGVGRVYWRQVKEVRIVAPHRSKFVAIDLCEGSDSLVSKDFLRRMLAAINRAAYGSPVVLSPALVGKEAFELVAIIDSYRPKHLHAQ